MERVTSATWAQGVDLAVSATYNRGERDDGDGGVDKPNEKVPLVCESQKERKTIGE